MTLDMPNDGPDDRTPSFLVITMACIRLVRLVVWFLGIAGLLYLSVTVPILATAGQETTLTVLYQMALDLELHVIVSYAAAGVFGGLWLKERHLRKVTVERENRRNRVFETQIDPGRTSSEFQE